MSPSPAMSKVRSLTSGNNGFTLLQLIHDPLMFISASQAKLCGKTILRKSCTKGFIRGLWLPWCNQPQVTNCDWSFKPAAQWGQGKLLPGTSTEDGVDSFLALVVAADWRSLLNSTLRTRVWSWTFQVVKLHFERASRDSALWSTDEYQATLELHKRMQKICIQGHWSIIWGASKGLVISLQEAQPPLW